MQSAQMAQTLRKKREIRPQEKVFDSLLRPLRNLCTPAFWRPYFPDKALQLPFWPSVFPVIIQTIHKLVIARLLEHPVWNARLLWPSRLIQFPALLKKRHKVSSCRS